MISEQTLRKIIRMRDVIRMRGGLRCKVVNNAMNRFEAITGRDLFMWTAYVKSVYLEAEQSLQESVLNIHITNEGGVLYSITPAGADEQSAKALMLTLHVDTVTEYVGDDV